MVQNLTFNTDLILPQTLSFIKDSGNNTLDILKSPVPTPEGRRAAKVMVSGFHQDVDSIIKQLHKLEFAEYNDWSIAVSLGNGEILKLLLRYFS